MLSFNRDSEQNYVITQTIYSAVDTFVMTVTWKADLSAKRVNTDPWREPDQADLDWFNKWHLPKFSA